MAVPALVEPPSWFRLSREGPGPWEVGGPDHATPAWDDWTLRYFFSASCCLGAPRRPASRTSESRRLWAPCRLQSIAASPPARNGDVATLAPPLTKRESPDPCAQRAPTRTATDRAGRPGGGPRAEDPGGVCGGRGSPLPSVALAAPPVSGFTGCWRNSRGGGGAGRPSFCRKRSRPRRRTSLPDKSEWPPRGRRGARAAGSRPSPGGERGGQRVAGQSAPKAAPPQPAERPGERGLLVCLLF